MTHRARAPWASALAITIPLALAYLLIAPTSNDLAAATYRSDLFSRAGFTLWDNGWYAGHPLPGYSLLSPALGAWLGVHLTLVLCALLSCVLFALLARMAFGQSAGRLASAWFALGLCAQLLSGRVAFDLGLAIGLGALLACAHGRALAALLLAFLTSLASPVAGAFLALAALAAGFTPRANPPSGKRASRLGFGICAAALAPIVALAIAFPEGGWEPFAPSAFWPGLAILLVIVLLLSLFGADDPQVTRRVRIGVLLYALTLIAAFAIRTPVGGNATRLGSLFAGPLLAGLLWERHRLALALLAPALLYWQLAPPLRDISTISGDPSTQASYYAPLKAELRHLAGSMPTRIEVPPLGSHWEADYLPGGELSLARGWERQLDTRYAPLFYRTRLTPAAYRAWLNENAVSYVALPDARLDGPSRKEAQLIDSGLPFLREIWRSAHWRLYEVRGAHPLVQLPARLHRLGVDSFALQAPRSGRYMVRVRFSPYWAIVSGVGCVKEAPGGWTQVQASRPGPIRVGLNFSLARVFDHGPRCG